MLKPLLITTATLFSATLVSFDTALAANPATQSHPVRDGHQELIARSNKYSNLNAQQQADIKSIHEVLTEVYRGINNHDVDGVTKFDAIDRPREKIYAKRLFKQLESMHIDLSTEVKSIDLLQLKKQSAIVKIVQIGRFTSPKKSGGYTQETTFRMIKQQGHWKIDVGQAIVKPFKEYS